MKLPLNNLNYPIRILIGNSSGSGFLVSHENKLYLVTARHVVYQQDQITKDFLLLNEKLTIVCHTFSGNKIQAAPRKYEVQLTTLLSNNNLKFHFTADLVVIKLGNLDATLRVNLVNGVTLTHSSDGSLVHYEMSGARKFEEVETTNDVFVLGYPVSLSTIEMKQINYDVPLVRKGIVAGKNYENKTIILDCPVYGGNSGGLVLEINRTDAFNINIHLIGVVVQYVPFIDQWRNVRFPELYNSNYQNSGYSIALPVDNIFDLIKEITTA